MSAPIVQADTGFVYVATGERYVTEAAASALTLRAHHPGARVCLITDQPRGAPFWDDLIVLAQPRFGFRDKLEMRRAPYRRAIFLDTDTRVCGDLSPLFAILARYDLCGVQACEGQDYEMEGGIPHAFPEMNGGLIGFSAGPATAEFFTLWERFYDEFRALNTEDRYHYANVGDQKSLRAALWHSTVRHATIGAEFNFIPFKLELVSLPVAVLHTRATAGLEPLAARLNRQLGRRVYVPGLDAVVTHGMTAGELPRLTSAVVKLWLRALGRAVLPRGVRDRLRRRGTLGGWLFGDRFDAAPAPASDRKWERPTATRRDS